MSRAVHDHERRGCAIGSEIAETATGGSFTPVEAEEIKALIRFWRRRVAYAIRPVETVNGEADFEIDRAHLTYALGRIHHYEQLLARNS